MHTNDNQPQHLLRLFYEVAWRLYDLNEGKIEKPEGLQRDLEVG